MNSLKTILGDFLLTLELEGKLPEVGQVPVPPVQDPCHGHSLDWFIEWEKIDGTYKAYLAAGPCPVCGLAVHIEAGSLVDSESYGPIIVHTHNKSSGKIASQYWKPQDDCKLILRTQQAVERLIKQ